MEDYRVRRLLQGLAATVLVIVAALALAATAGARDRNHDRIPDRWEKRHHLSLKVKQTRRDQDRDGLRNRAEWRARTDPRDADSDEDGIEDGDENAGKVTAYEDGVLTVTLFGGGELTAQVTSDTEVECRTPGETERCERGEREHGDDEDEEREDGEDDEREDGEEEDDVEEQDEDEAEEREDARCSTDALQVGAVVHEAELRVSSRGAMWSEIELITD